MAERRRDPVARDRYRAVARGAGVRPPERVRIVDGILVVAVALTALIALPRVASGMSAGLEQLAGSVQAAIPLLQGRGAIDLPAGGGASVAGAPVVDALPSHTRDPQLRISGRVPAFAIQPGRTVQVVLNGAVIATTPVEQNGGAFNTAAALKEGANAIGVALVGDRDVVASSSYTVVLDRTPPKLEISTPRAGASVDARDVVVAGLTDAGSTISVNGRTVLTGPDGAFTDSFSASAGTLQIAIVSRDRAGNETTQRLTVTAQEAAQVGAVTVSVTLDKATVRPGQYVVATVRVADARGPRANVPVTLSVGLFTIGPTTTNATGIAAFSFAAPPNEGDAGIIALAAGTSGRASLIVSAR
jgi:hypothetical protein